MTPRRPILRYYGGKWRLAPFIINQMPPHRIYVEPFGGAASVLLRKEPAYAEVYNDLNGELVNLFRVVRDSGNDLVEKLKLTPFSRAEFEKSYEPSENPLERARRTVVKSFQGFGSDGVCKRTGFRANSNRSGTTPAHDWKNFPECMFGIIERLRGVVIENRPAEEMFKQHDSTDTLFYVDPPYPTSTRKGGRYTHEMTDKDHEELAEQLHGLAGMVLISCYPCDLYERLYSGWEHRQIRNIALAGGKRTEVLFLNPAAQAAMAVLV